MWIVVNVGCIECGVSSNIVGVFTDRDRAHQIAEDFDRRFNWREGGQNSFEVFPMPVVDTIHDEYQSRTTTALKHDASTETTSEQKAQ